MNPLRTTALVCAVVVGCALAAAIRVEAFSTGITGVVKNLTCPGPCITPNPIPRYIGNDLTVAVRTYPELQLVARLFPTDGRFALELPPGFYRVRAFVGNGKLPSCWKESAKYVRVNAGEVPHVRLEVKNTCVD